MLLTGTMYIIDEPHIDVLKNNLMRMPPPGAALNPNTVICMDMDAISSVDGIYLRLGLVVPFVICAKFGPKI